MTSTTATPAPTTEELTLRVTRLIDAPIERVWTIATTRMADYFCPRPWRVEVVEQAWRAGGRTALIMHGPDGEHIPQEGVFLEVTPPTASSAGRFVFTDAFAAGWIPQGPFMVATVDFAPEGGRTRYTGTARHWTREAREQHEAMGFEQGWGIVAAQLAELAEPGGAAPR